MDYKINVKVCSGGKDRNPDRVRQFRGLSDGGEESGYEVIVTDSYCLGDCEGYGRKCHEFVKVEGTSKKAFCKRVLTFCRDPIVPDREIGNDAVATVGTGIVEVVETLKSRR